MHYHHRSALQKVSGAIARSSIISGGGGGGAGSAGSTSPDRGLSDTEKGAEVCVTLTLLCHVESIETSVTVRHSQVFWMSAQQRWPYSGGQ